MAELNEHLQAQCDVTPGIEDKFGTSSALGYLIGEKFRCFLIDLEHEPELIADVEPFVSEIKTIFQPWDIAQYLTELSEDKCMVEYQKYIQQAKDLLM